MCLCVCVWPEGNLYLCVCVSGGGGGGIIEIIFLFPGDGLMTGRARKWGGGYSGNLRYSLRDCLTFACMEARASKCLLRFTYSSVVFW